MHAPPRCCQRCRSLRAPAPPPSRVSALPMDAPDHSWIDPEQPGAAFDKHFGALWAARRLMVAVVGAPAGHARACL